MKIETLLDRISKAEETINKKQNTIIKKEKLIDKKRNQIHNKEGNDYDSVREREFLRDDIDWLEDDIRRLNKEIAEKQKSLEKYKEQLRIETEKENSRNIKVILDFLENWKARVTEFYDDSVDKWVKTLKEYREKSKEYNNWYYREEGYKASKEEKKVMKDKVNAARDKHGDWSFLDKYICSTIKVDNGDYSENNRDYFIDHELLKKDLDQEAKEKYDDLIERTNALIGEITDASYLIISPKGNLDGYIIGKKGKASITTIGAGGYNIQCYHFRTLIHKI